MKKEDKELLLKDLCARLPYGVKVLNIAEGVNEVCELDSIMTSRKHKDKIFVSLTLPDDSVMTGIEMVKPYLRPLSSMTEEEAKEIATLRGLKNILSVEINDEYIGVVIDDGFSSTVITTIWYDEIISSIECFDWLNKNHFDYRGLIPKNLAIELNNLNKLYHE